MQLLIVISSTLIVLKITSTYCKNYEFLTERAELLYVNESTVKDVLFSFGRVNRTFMALNASFSIVRDLNNEKLLGTIKIYQFFHNEYRFTGVKVTADICHIEKTNIFSLQEQFKNAHLHISLCNLKKGRYKIVNFAPHAKYFPDNLPRGKMRSITSVHDRQEMELFSVNWDFEIRDLLTTIKSKLIRTKT